MNFNLQSVMRRPAPLAFACALLIAACGGGGVGASQQSPPSPQTSTAAGASTPQVKASAPASTAAQAKGAPTQPTQRASGSAPSQPSAAGTSGGAGRGGTAGGDAGMNAAAGTGAAGSAGAVAGAPAGAGGAAADGCDRACLLMMMQKYLDAVVAHDPSKVPISPMLKMTDNGMPAKPGDGLWNTATMLVQAERLDYADPMTKNVGTQCVIQEGSSPAMYEVRLKVDGGMITEIESMTVRQADAANNFFDPSNLKPQPVFLEAPDRAKRMTRDQLMATLELYLDYLEGKKDGSMVPFDENCSRYENGVATATGLASFQLQSWGFMVTRRILILDEEAGIGWGMFPFMQSDSPLVVGEAFKMLDGKIMMIQAVMAYMPAKAWD